MSKKKQTMRVGNMRIGEAIKVPGDDRMWFIEKTRKKGLHVELDTVVWDSDGDLDDAERVTYRLPRFRRMPYTP